MTQKIEIGVAANTSGVESTIGKIEGAADGAADAVSGVASAARDANDELEEMAKRSERVAKAVREITEAQKILSQQLGRQVSLPDTATFLTNFERARKEKIVGIGRVRDFSSFEDWSKNYGRGFADPRAREAHRQRVLQYGMQGTTPPPNTPNNPPPPGPPPPGQPIPGVERAKSTALSFGKGMLALAGITSVAAMAGQAVDMHNEESIGIDTLKRRAGDLGQSFDKLEQQTRSAADGLGVTYVESQRMAQEFVKVAGTFKAAADLRTGMGFSRAFGLESGEGVNLFATMQRLKAPGADDQGSRRLALMIGEAVSKSGYSGKADEMIGAMSGLASEMTRATLAAPNMTAIAGYLTALTRSGNPGLDPNGAAALLGSADAATRRGGGMGDASLNFSYAAFSKASPGMNVVQAGALWQSGLFGTTNGTFGKDGALGEWMAANGLAAPGGMDDTPNLSKLMGQIHKSYGGNKWYMLDAIKNQFGLSSYAQAAALDTLNSRGPEDLGASQRLVGKAGLDFSKLSATGMYGIGKIAAARTPGELNSVASATLGRNDISEAEKGSIRDAMKAGSAEGLQVALAKVIGTHDQEKTEGSETRQTIADLKSELTRVGGAINAILNPIRSAVEMMAQALAPEEWKNQKKQEEADRKDKGRDFEKEVNAAQGSGKIPSLNYAYAEAEKAYYAEGGGYAAADKVAPKPGWRERDAFPEQYALQMATRNHLRSIAGAQALKLSPQQQQDLRDAAGGDEQKRRFLEGVLRTENRGRGTLPAAIDSTNRKAFSSNKGAKGYWQFIDGTWKEFGNGGDVENFRDGAFAAGRKYDFMKRQRGGNLAAMAADYNGGGTQARAVLAGKPPPAEETREYLSIMNATGALTPLPSGNPGGKPGGANGSAHVTGEVTVRVVDKNNKQIAPPAKAFVQPGAAGTTKAATP